MFYLHKPATTPQIRTRNLKILGAESAAVGDGLFSGELAIPGSEL